MIKEKAIILLIEDDQSLVELYKETFEDLGYKMPVAFDAQGGLDLAKKEKPDLILLDILLGNGDGFSFMEKLRQDSEISSIPVVAFSNYETKTAKEKAKELGIRDYLIKSNFTPSQLVKKLEIYLER